MSKKGGYQIIDLQNKNFEYGSGRIVFPGMYDSVVGSNKVILVSGIVVDGMKHRDCFGLTEIYDNEFIIQIENGDFSVHVQDNDVVFID